MHKNVACDVICAPIEVEEKTGQRLEFLIKADYKVEWIIENLPGATAYRTSEENIKQYEQGFPFGTWDDQVSAPFPFFLPLFPPSSRLHLSVLAFLP